MASFLSYWIEAKFYYFFSRFFGEIGIIRVMLILLFAVCLQILVIPALLLFLSLSRV